MCVCVSTSACVSAGAADWVFSPFRKIPRDGSIDGWIGVEERPGSGGKQACKCAGARERARANIDR